MRKDRLFFYSVVVSLVFHSSVLLIHRPFLSSTRGEYARHWEVIYDRQASSSFQKMKEKELFISSQKRLIKKRKKKAAVPFSPQPGTTMEKALFKKETAEAREYASDIKKIEAPQVLDPQKKVKAPLLVRELEKGSDPLLAAYKMRIVALLRERAFAQYANTREGGNIYIEFTVEKSGKLKNLNVISQYSSQSRYLREISLKSVMSLVPFPPLPEKMQAEEMTFQFIIVYHH